MANLLSAIKEAEEKRIALGHFNISDATTLQGIVRAIDRIRKEYHTDLPVIIGMSEGEEGYVGVKVGRFLVDEYRNKGYQLFLNADHCHSLERLEEIVRAGYDAVTFDMAKLSLEKNIKTSKEAIALAKNINPDFIFEGEMGYIGGSSSLLSDVPEDAIITADKMTDPEEAGYFAHEVGIDLITPAVGNLHGMLKHAKNPDLDIERIRAIRKQSGVPIVLHGGSGIKDSDFIDAINAGVAIVHINTEIRVAWRQGLEESFREDKDQVTPYKILPKAEKRIEEVVFERLKLFSKLI